MRKVRYAEVRVYWRYFNRKVFNGVLWPPPRFHLVHQKHSDLWGWTWVNGVSNRIRGIGINLSGEGGRYWRDTLLHEMVHQYEYEIEGKRDYEFTSHKNFDQWQDRIEGLGLPYSILTVEGHEGNPSLHSKQPAESV